MAYTGTGTQSDPFIVDNWTDFKALCPRYGAYITLRADAENKVMDVREDSSLEQDFFYLRAHINGNGWTIRNFCTGSYAVRLAGNSINNLHFANLISRFYPFYDGAVFTDCTFTAVLTDHACFMYGTKNYTPTFRRCSFSIRLMYTSTASLFYGNADVDGCMLRLSGSTEGLRLTDLGRLEDCMVTGALTLMGGQLLLDHPAGNCVFTLETDGTGAVIAETDSTLPNLVDTDLLADTLTKRITGANWFPLTTALMQDAAYVQDTIKFPKIRQ